MNFAFSDSFPTFPRRVGGAFRKLLVRERLLHSPSGRVDRQILENGCRRFQCFQLTIAACASFAVIGCAPPPPKSSAAAMAVGAPIGDSSDPNMSTELALAPPDLGYMDLGHMDLGDIDQTRAKSASMRFGEATELVQKPGPPPAAVEIVPAPEPDKSDVPAKPESPRRGDDHRELIPTPDGEAEGKADPTMSKSTEQASAETSVTAKPVKKNADAKAAATKSGGDAEDPSFPDGLDGPEDYRTWEKPAITMVFTGQQHGYIEPCGCTGLDRQKGGIARRYTFVDSLRDQGWDLVPMDAGNQVRRFGRQAAIKLQYSVRSLDEMNYQAVGFGPDDIRLGVGDLLAVAAEETMFVSANVVLFDPEYLPKTKLIEKNGIRIGVTSILDPSALETPPDDALMVNDPLESARVAAEELAAQSPDFSVLLFFGKDGAARDLVRSVPGFNLVVVAGGYGEPTYQAESIEDSKTQIIVTGDKGMYAGLVGLYPNQSMKYARVPLTHEFADAPPMRAVMKDYQDQLRDIGLGGLGLLPPIKHSSGGEFVGSETCGKCHTSAFEIWESSAHAEATEHLVHPPKERGDIARHFDPECLSCHVTGWNPQEYYPYETGYLALDQTPHLTGNGCENCHGPGAAHAAAEADGSTVAAALRDELREAMKLPLENAREKCMTCHDLDNSPDFHEPDAFEDVYWPEVEHYGVD